MFAAIAERPLLKRLKELCAACKLPGAKQFKLHSFRHHFASLCANHRVAYRKALAWLGHSSSEMLDLYYHLHDEDSQQAMQALAATGVLPAPDAKVGAGDEVPRKQGPSAPEGTLRAMNGSTIEKLLQVHEFQELAECIAEESERMGFEPMDPCGSPVFKTGTFGHSVTSPEIPLAPAQRALRAGAVHGRGDQYSGPAAQMGSRIFPPRRASWEPRAARYDEAVEPVCSQCRMNWRWRPCVSNVASIAGTAMSRRAGTRVAIASATPDSVPGQAGAPRLSRAGLIDAVAKAPPDAREVIGRGDVIRVLAMLAVVFSHLSVPLERFHFWCCVSKDGRTLENAVGHGGPTLQQK